MIRTAGVVVCGPMRMRRIARAGHRAAFLRPHRSVSRVALPLRCAVRALESGLYQKRHGSIIIIHHHQFGVFEKWFCSRFNFELQESQPTGVNNLKNYECNMKLALSKA